LYPTSTDARPGRDLADVSGNNSNSNNDNNNGYLIGSPYYRTEVGLFKNSDSPYGTFDQGGNILEWTEAIRRIDTGGSTTHAERAQRGGNWRENSAYEQASYRYGGSPRDENWYIGFRVVQAYVPQAVPEPATLLGFGIPMLMIGLGKLRGLRK
jgi:formylglycine-generating enzyme required for sulfatase activity